MRRPSKTAFLFTQFPPSLISCTMSIASNYTSVAIKAPSPAIPTFRQCNPDAHSDSAQDEEKKPFKSTHADSDFLNTSSPPPPCIIATRRELFLFQRPFDKSGAAAKGDPVLMMRNPLFPPTFGSSDPPFATDNTPYNRKFALCTPHRRVPLPFLSPPPHSSHHRHTLQTTCQAAR